MAPKERKSLFTQTSELFKAVTKPFKKSLHTTPSSGEHTLLSLSKGLQFTPGTPLSDATRALLPVESQQDSICYLLTWPEALRLYPDLIPTALPRDLAQALHLPVIDNIIYEISSPHKVSGILPGEINQIPPEIVNASDGEGIEFIYEEQTAEWEAAFSELRPGLPSLDDIGSLTVLVQLFGHNLQLRVNAGPKPIEIGSEWMVRVGSYAHVGLPLWLWQLNQALPFLQELLNKDETRRQAYGYLQRIQEAVIGRTPQHTLTLDALQLNEQRFVGVSHFQVAVVRSRYGNTADVIPYSDDLQSNLGLTEEELKRTLQQALSEWSGQEILLLKDKEGEMVYASLMLTETQTQALKHLKEKFYQRPLKEIKQFVYFPTQTAKSEAFQQTFQLDLSEYGPRVMGIGPIIHGAGAFGKSNTVSMFERIGIDEEIIDSGDDRGVAQAAPEAFCELAYAEGDEAQTRPLVHLSLPATNHGTEANLEGHIELETADDLLNKMKYQLLDETAESQLFTFPDAISKQDVDLPLTASFLEIFNIKVQELKKAFNKASLPDDNVEEAPERNQFAQIANNTDEALYQENSGGQGSDKLFKQVQQWVDQVPHLKVHINLFDYQKDGVSWLTYAFMKGYPGVLFADDMGLGKTLQSLSFLSLLMNKAWYKRHHEAQSLMFDKAAFQNASHYRHPILVVVPPVLIKNFEKQAADFFEQSQDNFAMLLLHAEQGEAPQQFYIDATKKGKETEDATPRLDRDKLMQYRMIVTTYDYVVTYQHSFARIPWSILLCDEVQKAKSIRSKVSVALKAIASNTCFKLMMTGTPVENDMNDLYNIMDIAVPGYLAPSLKDFRKLYAPLFNIDLSEDEITAQSQVEDSMLDLKSQLGFGDIRQGHMIGRLKEDVGSGLPNKYDGAAQEIVTIIPYEEYRSVRNLDLLPLQLLQELKRFSLHPNHNQPYSADQLLAWIQQSPRLKAVLNKLVEIKVEGNQDKALLFCEYHCIQEPLQKAINQLFNLPSKFKAVNSNLVNKEPVIEAFQNYEGFCALVLSPKCAGMGLNLQEANHVFHVSRWWNPAIEDQATCRAYRTGQKKDVYVYYCLSQLDQAPNGEKTFDEALHELLSEKRRKRTDLLSPGYSQNISESILADKMNIQFKETIETLDALGQVGPPGKSFEKWVKDRLEKEAFRVERTNPDMGIDFIAYPDDKGEPFGIQVKHSSCATAKTVLSDIRRFPTDLIKHNLRQGVFMTNQFASAEHRQDLESFEPVEIKMFDRQNFTDYFSSSKSLSDWLNELFSQ